MGEVETAKQILCDYSLSDDRSSLEIRLITEDGEEITAQEALDTISEIILQELKDAFETKRKGH